MFVGKSPKKKKVYQVKRRGSFSKPNTRYATESQQLPAIVTEQDDTALLAVETKIQDEDKEPAFDPYEKKEDKIITGIFGKLTPRATKVENQCALWPPAGKTMNPGKCKLISDNNCAYSLSRHQRHDVLPDRQAG